MKFQIKTILLFMSFFLSKLELVSQSIISPGYVSGTWTKSSSPYKVTGDVTVPKDSILTIEPGTLIEFQDNYGIKVDGILKADGKLGDSIVFKAASSKAWAGINFVNNSQSDTIRFKYCKFENYKNGYKFGIVNYALYIKNSNPVTISNCLFNYTYSDDKQCGSIYILKNVAFVTDVYFKSKANFINSIATLRVDSAIYFELRRLEFDIPENAGKNGPDLVIANFNGLKGIISDISNKGKTSFVMGIQDSKNVELLNSTLQYKSSLGIRKSKCYVKNVHFENIFITAIKTFDNCTGTIFENCEIRNCGSNVRDIQWNMRYMAMDLQSSGPLFKNCRITDNDAGMIISQQYGAGTPVFLNCEISNNVYYPIYIEGFPTFINCNILSNSTFLRHPGDTLRVLPYSGGVIVATEFYPSRPYFYNTILWGNRDSLGNENSIVFYGNNTTVKADLKNCILQGDSSKGIVGYDENAYKKFQINPNYLSYINSSGIPPGFKDSSTGDYFLTNTCSQTAYAINRGQQGNLLTQHPFSMLKSQYGIDIYNSTDLAGNPRVMDDTIDIGCYESSGTKKALTLRGSYLDSTVCYGGANTYDSKSFGTIQNYQWQKKQNNTITTVSAQNKLNLINQRTDGIQYRLKVSNTECMQLSDSSNWFTITVNNPNKKGITKNPNKDTIQLKETMVLSTTASGYSSILWSDNSNKATISFKGSDLGALGTYQFSIEARKSNDCVETDTVYITTKANVGIDNILNEAIKIYPNPSKDIIHITNKDNQSFKWMVYNSSGQEVLSGNESESINMANVPSGVYMLRIQSKDLDQAVRVSKVEN